MIRFPNAKINLGLRIVARRPDGYHNIETVFYPVQLQDALEIVPTSQQETELSLSGIVIDGDLHRLAAFFHRDRDLRLGLLGEELIHRIGKAFCLRAYVGGLFVGYSGIAGRVGEGYRFPSGRGVER